MAACGKLRSPAPRPTDNTPAAPTLRGPCDGAATSLELQGPCEDLKLVHRRMLRSLQSRSDAARLSVGEPPTLGNPPPDPAHSLAIGGDGRTADARHSGVHLNQGLQRARTIATHVRRSPARMRRMLSKRISDIIRRPVTKLVNRDRSSTAVRLDLER